MFQPRVSYARARDGVAIAYTTFGDGAIPIVVAAPLIGQLEIDAEVADRLRASPFTVDGRLRRVFAKLSVSTRVELTAEYARLARR